MQSSIKLAESELEGTETQGRPIHLIYSHSGQILPKLLLYVCLVQIMIIKFMIQAQSFLVVLCQHAAH